MFFPDTHEVLWLEGGYLLRSWMDKTNRTQLCQLPGDANATELENGNGTGAALRGVASWGLGKLKVFCMVMVHECS